MPNESTTATGTTTVPELHRKKFNLGVRWAKAAFLKGAVPCLSSFNYRSKSGRWVLKGILAEAFAGKYGRMDEKELLEASKAIFE
jgi:hypothetical protein